MTRLAWAVPFLALAACAAWAARACRWRPVRAARYRLTRLRYARRMRGPLPARDQDVPYCRRRWLEVLDAYEAAPARAERSRT